MASQQAVPRHTGLDIISQRTFLLKSILPTKLVKLVFVAVEYVDVYLAAYAPHMAVGAKLPIDQFHVGLVFAVARYPYVVVVFNIGGRWQIAVYKALAHVQDGAPAGGSLNNVEPCLYAPEHGAYATHGRHLLVGGLHIEHWRKVAGAKLAVTQKETSLCPGRCAVGKEVIGAYSEAVAARLNVVGRVIGVE